MISVKTVGRDLDTERAFALHYACFGDGREWFDAFLAVADGEKYIAYTIGAEYIGGMFFLDMTCGVYKGRYIYALCVTPAYRGRGVAAALLREAKRLSPDFTLICAADELLAETYARHGFDTFVGGTVRAGEAFGARMDTSAFQTPCTYADVRGLKLSEKLFSFALSECGGTLCTDGNAVVAKAENGVYGAWGIPPVTEKKAQMYLRTSMDTSGITTDLILEI